MIRGTRPIGREPAAPRRRPRGTSLEALGSWARSVRRTSACRSRGTATDQTTRPRTAATPWATGTCDPSWAEPTPGAVASFAPSPCADDRVEGRNVPAPMVEKDHAVCMAQDMPQHEDRHDRVVERPSHRDELRDQVYGREEPDQGEPQPSFAAAGNPRIANQPAEQDHEVGDQRGQLPRLGSASEGNEDQHRQHPYDGCHCERDQNPAKHTTKATGVLVRVAPLKPRGGGAATAQLFTHDQAAGEPHDAALQRLFGKRRP